MEGMVKELLRPAFLDPVAQNILLEETPIVFSDADRMFFSEEPSMEETKESVWSSNVHGSPGIDGITSLFYKVHWDLVGDLLHQVILENFKRRSLTKTKANGMVIFAPKPKKAKSTKPKDLRRISLLNTDYKIYSGIPARRITKRSKTGLSDCQYVACKHQLIYHAIALAAAAIDAGMRNKREGCGLLDNDYKAAFDLMDASWPIKVLEKKGCGPVMVEWLSSFFRDVYSIVVFNGILGAKILLERSLRQGDLPSMILFGIGIDPHLIRLNNRLRGIFVYSTPTLGPVLPNEAPLGNTEERYKVTGYADDCKPAITSMAEFSLVETETRLFEAASGCELHRDPTSGKVKFLRLGRWRGTLQSEDLPPSCRYIAFSEHLDMLGVPLYASFRKTKQNSGEDLKEKLRKKTGPWLSKNMPLIQRAFSVNCYLLPKVWFRCHIVPLRKGDSDNFKKVVNRFVFADQLEKPKDLIKYRSRCNGGLQLHNIDCKALAVLIKIFLEMSISSKFRTSIYFSALYEFYVLDNTSISPPRRPPFYSQHFFDVIKSAREENQIAEWSSKQWYCYLLGRNHLQKEVLDVDGESRWEDVQCPVETVFPNFDWEATWARTRLPGLNNDCRSFLWLYFHNLLPGHSMSDQMVPDLMSITHPNFWPK